MARKSAFALDETQARLNEEMSIYEPTGEVLLVTDSWNDGVYRDAATMEFFGTEASYRSNQMGIGFRER